MALPYDQYGQFGQQQAQQQRQQALQNALQNPSLSQNSSNVGFGGQFSENHTLPSQQVGQPVHYPSPGGNTGITGGYAPAQSGQVMPAIGAAAGEIGALMRGRAPRPDVLASGAQGALPAPAASSLYAPSGWDQSKWADPNYHSIKYDVGRILDPYTHNGMISQADIANAMPQIQALYPGARASGDGYITPDGQFIDLIQGAKAGNGTGKFQYLDPSQQGHGGSPQGQALGAALGGGLNSAGSMYSSTAANSLLRQLMQQLGLNLNGIV